MNIFKRMEVRKKKFIIKWVTGMNFFDWSPYGHMTRHKSLAIACYARVCVKPFFFYLFIFILKCVSSLFDRLFLPFDDAIIYYVTRRGNKFPCKKKKEKVREKCWFSSLFIDAIWCVYVIDTHTHRHTNTLKFWTRPAWWFVDFSRSLCAWTRQPDAFHQI